MALARGSVGPQVKQLQGTLNLLPSIQPPLKLDSIFGPLTETRVKEFQSLNFLSVDGIVGSLTLAALDLAFKLLKQDQSTIRVTQHNNAALTGLHNTTTPIVLPPVTVSHDSKFRFVEVPAIANIHEFLFKIEKSGSVFWMGAAVPENTSDFTRVQVFFHPTVRQKDVIVADDADYAEFKGGWSTTTRPAGSIQRYVSLQGVQIATAGRKIALLVPFTTMAALARASSNMFSDRPVETILAVLQSIGSILSQHPQPAPNLTRVGASSFSSGIHAMKNFLGNMRSSGLVREIIDFDGPLISGSAATVVPAPRGVASKCFSQVSPVRPVPGYVTVRRVHFSNVRAYDHLPEGPRLDRRLHGRIGFMMYHQAMANSAIR